MPQDTFSFFLSGSTSVQSCLVFFLFLCLCVSVPGLASVLTPASLALVSCSLSPSSELQLQIQTQPVSSLQPYSMMARWALVLLMVPTLGRVLFVSGTPTPTFRLLSQNDPETVSYSVALERHSATTPGPSASRSYSKANPHPDTRITLSLDVPIGLLRILLEQARTKAARDQAATNAQILARVGRH
ncbi:urocortin-2 [Peromyscus maniculatus bairdii]|uniref:urocortin-2 n=1 Tax=Peromyscus maniculatus bairdii TaxID=230844 RepID=UPI003FCF0F7C